MVLTRPPVGEVIETLSAACVDVKSQWYSWTDNMIGDDWHVVYPDPSKWTTGKLLSWLEDQGHDTSDLATVDYAFLRDELINQVEEAMYSGEHYVPMMNFIYPVILDNALTGQDLSPDEAQSRLDGLPVVVVWVDQPHNVFDNEHYYLALSGGGMDLSWEICEAYIRLGQLPPVYFCDLPAMAGRGTSEQDQLIIAACKRSVEVAQLRLGNTARTLNGLG